MASLDRKEAIRRFEHAQDRLVLQASDLSLATIAGMATSGAIDVAPLFQRRERWNAAKQAALIESFLLNIPVPPVYLAEDDFGRYSVIDGKQRITAIRDFMQDTLVLVGLTRFTEVEGLRFSELPEPLQNALNVRPYIRAVTLLRQSDPEIKYEVFHRLNAGGEPLNAQEIRNVIYRGPLNSLVYELAEHPFLKQQLKIHGSRAPAYRKMQDAEYVLRFLTLLHDWEAFSGDIRRSLDSFMRENQSAESSLLDSWRSLFTRALETAREVWDDHAFHRFESGAWRDQTLAGMFDAQMVALALLDSTQQSIVVTARAEVDTRTKALFDDSEFELSVRQATNTPRSVRYRILAMKSLLESVS